MVERPIKKADRQLKPEINEATPSARQSDDSDKKRSPRSGGGKDKRDKRGSRDEEVKQPVNLALVRGPKPTKPQPVVEEVIAEVSEEITEESKPEETTEA
ncbi:MAG: hypothetical protein DCF20_12120 [Pseudanabaena sp.]|nr:MAG: hypothetical protein DCF20_12120 [Pseudanabaena sp.]